MSDSKLIICELGDNSAGAKSVGEIKVSPMAFRTLTIKNHCDVCGKPRSSGLNLVKHKRCSEIRRQRYLRGA